MFDNNTIIFFGISKNFFSYLTRTEKDLRPAIFSDNNPNLWGEHPAYDERICIDPKQIPHLDKALVIITAENPESILNIENQLDALEVIHYRVRDLLNQIDYYESWSWVSNIQYKRIHKFIDITLRGTTSCNFHCAYCYVWRKNGYVDGLETSAYPINSLLTAFSLTKLGGPCFVNICASGETLLSKDIIPLLFGLLKTGHFVSVVTNGTYKKKIDEILNFPKEYLSRFFFKISFHYEELLKRNLMNAFWDNVYKIQDSPSSYTLEITPYDGIENEIDTIREIFDKNANGALPHISVPRDSTKIGFDLYSQHDISEFTKIWGESFSSRMFDLKSRWYGKKITQYCHAGKWSYLVRMPDGNVNACYRQYPISNIFTDEYPFLNAPMAHDCNMPYCFNNHAFLAWGCVPDIKDYSYYDMRNRTDRDGKNWIKYPVNVAMQQKLYDNNFEYAEHWDDYEKLFDHNRLPAIILFNSPDYLNLGDHAIALATRLFFQDHFPDRVFIEVACEQYERENITIKDCIKPNDLILICGGGNLGSLWLRFKDAAMDIIYTFSKNTIIILPQTIYFDDSQFGNREKRIMQDVLQQHHHLIFLLRDKKSYTLAKEAFADHIVKNLSPDMTFYLQKIIGNSYNSTNRKYIYLCLRNDKEKNNFSDDLENKFSEEGITWDTFSTISQYPVFLNNRKEAIFELFQKFAFAKVIFTDRLHCMLFCALTYTPCVFIDELSQKISGSYEWIQGTPFIQKYDSNTSLQAQINRVCDAEKIAIRLTEDLLHNFKDFANFLKEVVTI